MVRFAHLDDIMPIATLYHSVWHETQAQYMLEEERLKRNVQFFAKRINTLRANTLIEERGVSIVAFAAWDGALLRALYVAKSYRGTGLAIVLLSAAEASMASRGVKEAELHCVVGNKQARRFYEKSGWQHNGAVIDGPPEARCWKMLKMLPTFVDRSANNGMPVSGENLL